MLDNTQNSTGNTEIDSGLDSTFGQSNQNYTLPPAVSNGKGINLQQVLAEILKASGQGLTSAGNFVNPQQTQSSNENQNTPLQDGANKYIKEKGYDYAKDAHENQGMSLQDLQNHPLMNSNINNSNALGNLLNSTGQQGGNPTPMSAGQTPQQGGNQDSANQIAILQALMAKQGGQLPTQGNASTSDQNGQYNGQTKQNVSNQNLQEINKIHQQGQFDINHPVGSALNLIGDLTGINGMRALTESVKMNNVIRNQELTGTQQFQGSEYPKAVLENQKEIDLAMRKPLTQEEQATYGSNIYAAKAKMLNDSLESTNKEYENSLAAIKDMGEYRDWSSKNFTGAMPDVVKEGFSNLDTLDLKRIQLRSSMTNLSKNAPPPPSIKKDIDNWDGVMKNGVKFKVNK